MFNSQHIKRLFPHCDCRSLLMSLSSHVLCCFSLYDHVIEDVYTLFFYEFPTCLVAHSGAWGINTRALSHLGTYGTWKWNVFVWFNWIIELILSLLTMYIQLYQASSLSEKLMCFLCLYSSVIFLRMDGNKRCKSFCCCLTMNLGTWQVSYEIHKRWEWDQLSQWGSWSRICRVEMGEPWRSYWAGVLKNNPSG